MQSVQLYEAALGLSEDQRAALAYQLLQSLPPSSGSSEQSDGFFEELDRRVDAYEQGNTSASDWHDVSERIREALDRAREP
jgi:putative addiction module component (TIGR02574 family)